jgi:hypothetical protein
MTRFLQVIFKNHFPIFKENFCHAKAKSPYGVLVAPLFDPLLLD